MSADEHRLDELLGAYALDAVSDDERGKRLRELLGEDKPAAKDAPAQAPKDGAKDAPAPAPADAPKDAPKK